MNYSASAMGTPAQPPAHDVERRDRETLSRVNRYLERLFEPLAERVARRVEDRLVRSEDRLGELIEHLETLVAQLEILQDPATVEDLRADEVESDEDARPYDEIRRELGLA
jgi:hypothetical protein